MTTTYKIPAYIEKAITMMAENYHRSSELHKNEIKGFQEQLDYYGAITWSSKTVSWVLKRAWSERGLSFKLERVTIAKGAEYIGTTNGMAYECVWN